MAMNKFNNVAKFYDNFFVQIFYFFVHRQNIKIVKEFIKEKTKILDIGCGTGNFLNKIEKIDKKLKLVGTDRSEEMIKIAKNKFKNINFFLTSADNLPFENNYFDLITIIDAFYYFKNKDRVIFECHRTLKTGAHLFIYIPSIDAFSSRLLIKFSKCFPTEMESKHLRFVELKNVTEKYGFSIVVKKLKYFPFTPLKYWSLVLTKK